MNRIIAVISLLMTTACSASAQHTADTAAILKWYYVHYPFVTMKDSIFTFESEFKFPEGFHRPDSSELTPFQNWVSHFPLWHRWKPVGNWKGGKEFESDQISRAVHLPWKGERHTDQTIPVRILGEWLYYQHREPDLKIVPKIGDTLRYEDFLGGQLLFNNHMAPFFKPTVRRPNSASEFYHFLMICLDQTSYASLTANCDSVSADSVEPGDLFVAHDESGRRGRVYVVMVKLVDDHGNRLYTVASGCPEACDFHIPLLTEDRDSPWVTVEKIEQLAPEYPQRGFFRLRVQ